MKKALIAGAASTVLAAMPVVGVFATGHLNGTPIQDNFQITVEDVCTFTRKEGSTHPEATIGTGMTATGNGWTNVTGTTDLFTASVIAGNTYDSFAKSQFNVQCNEATGGYKVTATAGDLAATGVTNGIKYNAGGYAGTGSSWFLSSDATGATPSIVWQHAAYDPSDTTNTSKLDQDDFIITYSMKIDLDQDVATYTGNVSYALADLQ